MMIQFTLTMPSNNSWNGKWSGEESLYALVRSYRDKAVAQKILDAGYQSYSFGDGWRAAIESKEIGASTAEKVRKKSNGFCGYDWMVDSIERHGVIRSSAA